ncbi:hypothetical protein C2W64_04789 [Brevibacillus laterosporus]|nr:hypothetical protein C2W64_04789 [Brevibacillus laterosporus]
MFYYHLFSEKYPHPIRKQEKEKRNHDSSSSLFINIAAISIRAYSVFY